MLLEPRYFYQKEQRCYADGNGDDYSPVILLQQLGPCELAKITPVQNAPLQLRVDFRKYARTNEHPRNSPKQRIQGSLANRAGHGTRAVTENAESHAENEAAENS